MKDQIRSLIGIDMYVNINTNTTKWKLVRLINVTDDVVCFIKGDVKVYIPTPSITSLTHE